MDSLTVEKRSRNMAAIRSKDTKPEVFLRKLLFSNGLRYRKNVNYVYGHPDLYLAKFHTAVFVHGCFWHRHSGCKYAYTPKSRIEFWQKKFDQNQQRDKEVRSYLKEKNIRQLVVWECTIKSMSKNHAYKDEVIRSILAFLHSDEPYLAL